MAGKKLAKSNHRIRTVCAGAAAIIASTSCRSILDIDGIEYRPPAASESSGATSGESSGGENSGGENLGGESSSGAAGSQSSGGESSSTTGGATSGAAGSGVGGCAEFGRLTCAAGRANCDGCLDNGCEVALDADEENCGRCGRSCSGQACGFGTCEPETLSAVDLGKYIYQTAVDDTHVYLGWEGRIEAIRKTGGLYGTLCSGGETSGLFVYGPNVYFLRLFEGTVNRVPKVGGKCATLATAQAHLGTMFVDETSIFFTNHANVGFIAKVSRGGGDITKFAEGQGEGHDGLATDDEYVYWGSPSGLYRARKVDGSDRSKIAKDKPLMLAVDDAYVYFRTLEAIVLVPKAGGSIVNVTTEPAEVSGLLVDESRVYWRTPVEGSVKSVRKDGTELHVLAKRHPYPSGGGFAMDKGFVYWVGAMNRLYRTPK